MCYRIGISINIVTNTESGWLGPNNIGSSIDTNIKPKTRTGPIFGPG